MPRHKPSRPARGVQPEPSGMVMAFEPIKPRVYGDTKTVVATAVGQGGGAKAVADFLQRSLSVVYGYTDPLVERSDLSLDQARRMTQYQRVTAFAEDLAVLAGGTFVPGEGTADKTISEYTVIANRDVTHLVELLMAALEDGRIDEAEQAALLPVVDDLHRDVTALRNRLRAQGGTATAGGRHGG